MVILLENARAKTHLYISSLHKMICKLTLELNKIFLIYIIRKIIIYQYKMYS